MHLQGHERCEGRAHEDFIGRGVSPLAPCTGTAGPSPRSAANLLADNVVQNHRAFSMRLLNLRMETEAELVFWLEI